MATNLQSKSLKTGHGFDVEPVEAAKTGLLCSECELILNQAVQTADGIRFCQECFKDIEK